MSEWKEGPPTEIGRYALQSEELGYGIRLASVHDPRDWHHVKRHFRIPDPPEAKPVPPKPEWKRARLRTDPDTLGWAFPCRPRGAWYFFADSDATSMLASMKSDNDLEFLDEPAPAEPTELPEKFLFVNRHNGDRGVAVRSGSDWWTLAYTRGGSSLFSAADIRLHLKITPVLENYPV